MEIGIAGIILIILNIVVSYKGFKDDRFFRTYCFEIDKILLSKEYKRLFTAGFLHVSWPHLLFNMVSLYYFSGIVELFLGELPYLLIYFASLLGGKLFSLFVHRYHGDYSSVGASGAVSGVIFSSIAFLPEMGIAFFGFPFPIPIWIFGILYILASIYGIKSKDHHVGHEAHFGGALIGLLVSIAFYPDSLIYHYVPIALIILPSALCIYVAVKKPEFLILDTFFRKKQMLLTVDDRYNIDKKNKEDELDRILEKIHDKGMNSLTEREKAALIEYSKK